MKLLSQIIVIEIALITTSCVSLKKVDYQRDSLSPEERIRKLERSGNSQIQRVAARSQEQRQADLVEIERFGLVQRAREDIQRKLGDVTVDSWTIGYFFSTNTVLCDVRYATPGTNRIQQIEFGYERTGTNWSLLWDAGLR